jgi:N-acetylglucosamine-6-phosphate deacetylase
VSRVLRGRVVTADSIVDGELTVADGVIADLVPVTDVRPRDQSSPAKPEPDACWIVPGFVDIHVHGGGGDSFTTGDPAQARAAAAFHTGHGTTTLLASLVASDAATLNQALTAYQPLVVDGTIAGLHLEGPYLSVLRCGAQNPRQLRDPDPAELSSWLESGIVRVITIAPELPGGVAAIEMAVAAGVVAAVGHTDATYEQTLAAVAAGATLATHLANAMRPINHRAPGPIVALLDAPGVVCEQVVDGVHLHEGMVNHVVRTAGPDRVALVTDAIAAAGAPDGEYELGGQGVRVSGGVARLVGGVSDGAIAGSTLTMAAAFRNTVQLGVSMVDAVRMASTTPARTIGLADRAGLIASGRSADLVLLDEDLRVVEVLRGGVTVARR